MNSSPRNCVSLISAVALALGATARSQDFFRDFGASRSSAGLGPFTPSDYGYRDQTVNGLRPVAPPEESAEDRYNFAAGPLRFCVAAGVGFEFNDNITLSDHDRESDVIFRPSLSLDASWRMSELNTLRFGLEVSYAKYFDHSQYDTDGLLISPTSELAFTFEIGAFKITVRDRGSYQEDAYDDPTLSNIARYRRAENQAGIEVDWALNQNADVVFGYDHYNLWTFDPEFSADERAVETVFLKPGFQVAPALKIGAVGAFSWINFKESSRQDGTNLLLGPFIEWKISDVMTFYVEGGVQDLNFDGASTFDEDFFQGLTDEERSLFADDEDSSSWYVKFELDHRANEYFSHRLLGSKTAEIGIGSAFYDLYHIEYIADWKNFIANTEFSPSLFYEHFETSGTFAEEGDRVGTALALRYHLTNTITLGLDYRFIWKDSNLPDADYYQNLAFLSIYYKF
jgi:hypothetical protein